LKTGFFSEQHQRFRAGSFWWLRKNAKWVHFEWKRFESYNRYDVRLL